MQLIITAAECCVSVKRGVKASVLEHLTAHWCETYVNVTDPEWTNEPCAMAVSDLKSMGFESPDVIYGNGPRQRFTYAL